MIPNKPATSSIEKAIQLLLRMAEENREVGTTEIANLLGMHKATVSRMLIKLEEYDFVYKSKESRKYWLGPAIHQLGMIIADTNFKQVRQVARPLIDQLRDKIGETVALEIWLGNSTVPTYSALPDHPLRVIPPPGEPLDLHAAAGAKTILSFMHSDMVDVLLQGELPQITDKTITDKPRLKALLKDYLKQGFAVDNEEFHAGICAIATPVFNRLRQPIAAIVILMPASRQEKMMNDSMVSKLKQTANLVTKQLAVKRI